jgi:hypothetical protein
MCPLGLEDQRLCGRAGSKPGQHLGGDRVQPGKAVRSGDRQYPTVGQVDCGQTLDQEPLLAQGIAIVRGNRAINTLTRDGSGPAQQRTGPSDGRRAVGVALSARARSRSRRF